MKTNWKIGALLAWMMPIAMLFCGCKNNGTDVDDPTSKELHYAWVNINDQTKAADILLACSNGSHMICDVNHDNKNGMLYFNNATNANIYDGYYIFVDSTGTPMMLCTPKGDFFFKNVTENSCDLAYRADEQAEPVYYFGVQLDGDEAQGMMLRKGTASWGESVTAPFTKWWSEMKSFDWTWDDHQRKAIVPYLAKVTTFAITAVSVVGEGDVIGGFITLYEEALKSGLVEGSLVSYIDAYKKLGELGDLFKLFTGQYGLDDVQGFAVDYISEKISANSEYQLDHLATFNEISWEIFNHPEEHIALSRYKVQIPKSGGLAMIKVTAQDGWYVSWDVPSWIGYTVDGSYINMSISPNDESVPREHTILVYPRSGALPARLTIVQEGDAFALDPTEITFTGMNAHNAILVKTNDQVRSWRVKSCPNWLNYETSTTTIWLDTNPMMSMLGDQTGAVVVEATLQDGSTVEQSCTVIWKPGTGDADSWDGTTWIFSGTITGDDGSGGTASMRLAIHSVAAHTATISIGAYSNISATVYANGIGSVQGTFGANGMTGTYTVTRTGETTATCTVRMTIQGAGSGGGTMQGTKQ